MHHIAFRLTFNIFNAYSYFAKTDRILLHPIGSWYRFTLPFPLADFPQLPMLAHIIYSLFMHKWSGGKKRTASIMSTKSRLDRVSLKALSVRSLASAKDLLKLRPQRKQWVFTMFIQCDQVFSANAAVFEAIMQFLGPSDAVKLIHVCRSWSAAAVEAFYETPPLIHPESFSQLVTVLGVENPLHPYALLIRELLISAPVAENMLMGDLKDVLEMCNNLISLRIEGCTHLTNMLAQFLAEHVPGIYRLELPGCFVSDSFVDGLISGCNSIRHLDLSHTNTTLACMPAIIQDCIHLTSLDLTGIQPMTNRRPGAHFSLEMKKSHIRYELTRVSFASTDITDAIIQYLTHCCVNLECILLDACAFITDSAAMAIAQNCPRITTLGFSYCPNITDVGLQSLSVHLSMHITEPVASPMSYSSFQEHFETVEPIISVRLSSIYLAGCYRITHSGLVMLAKACPLETVILDGCDHIMDWYADAVSKHKECQREQEENLLTLSGKQIIDRQEQGGETLVPR